MHTDQDSGVSSATEACCTDYLFPLLIGCTATMMALTLMKCI